MAQMLRRAVALAALISGGVAVAAPRAATPVVRARASSAAKAAPASLSRAPSSGPLVNSIKTAARYPRTFSSGLGNSIKETLTPKFGGFSRALRTASTLTDQRLARLPPGVQADLAGVLLHGAVDEQGAAGQQFLRVLTARGRTPGRVMAALSRLSYFDEYGPSEHLSGPASKEFSSLMAQLRAQPGDWAAFHKFAEDATAAPERAGTIELLIDGHRYFPAIEKSIDAATRYVLAVQYELHSDDAGWQVAERLGAAAQRGVYTINVNDQVGSVTTDRSLFRYLDEQGVHHIDRASQRVMAGQLEHRKMIVVDGREGFIGGMNVGTAYRDRWHDVQSRVTGPVVADMTDSLVREDKALGLNIPRGLRAELRKQRAAARSAAGPSAGSTGIRLVLHDGLADQNQKLLYLRAIDTCSKRVLIENPYLSDSDIVAHLAAAARRGVRVVVIVPHVNDQTFGSAAARSHYQELIESGAEVYEYIGPNREQPQMSHGKVALFDDEVATIGSSNLDARSLVHNHEANIWVRDAQLVHQMASQVFDVDIERSERIREYQPTMLMRLEDGIARKLAPHL